MRVKDLGPRTVGRAVLAGLGVGCLLGVSGCSRPADTPAPTGPGANGSVPTKANPVPPAIQQEYQNAPKKPGP